MWVCAIERESQSVFLVILTVTLPEIVNYEFDTKDLICLAISSVVGVWYILKKVTSCYLTLE